MLFTEHAILEQFQKHPKTVGLGGTKVFRNPLICLCSRCVQEASYQIHSSAPKNLQKFCVLSLFTVKAHFRGVGNNSQNGRMIKGNGATSLIDMRVRDCKLHSVFRSYIYPSTGFAVVFFR